MRGLVKKDALQLAKDWLPIYATLSIILIVASFWLKTTGILVMIFFTVLLSTNIHILFSSDRNSNWLAYLSAVGIPKQKLVGARYLTEFFLGLISGMVMFIEGLVVTLNPSTHFTVISALIVSIITLVVSLIYMIFLTPFLYVFGQNGVILPVILMVGVGYGLTKIPHINFYMTFFTSHQLYLAGLAVLFLVFLFIISFVISLSILPKVLKIR